MAILAFASIYPHYYGFWTLWGYLNDDFYEQVLKSKFSFMNHFDYSGSTPATIQCDRSYQHSDGAQTCRLKPASLPAEIDGDLLKLAFDH